MNPMSSDPAEESKTDPGPRGSTGTVGPMRGPWEKNVRARLRALRFDPEIALLFFREDTRALPGRGASRHAGGCNRMRPRIIPGSIRERDRETSTGLAPMGTASHRRFGVRLRLRVNE